MVAAGMAGDIRDHVPWRVLGAIIYQPATERLLAPSIQTLLFYSIFSLLCN